MKKGILISLAVMLVAMVLIPSMVVAVPIQLPSGQSVTPMAPKDSSGNLTAMIVFYTITDEMYLFWCDMDATIKDRGDKWDVHSNQGNWNGVNKDTVTYGYYKYKEIQILFDEEGNEIPQYMVDLDLEPMGAEGLPESGHYARLDAVFVSDALKAEVARYFEGQWYIGIRCLVTLSAMQAYQAGDLELGDYVWVYYSSDPRPGHEGETVPIVVDKVMYP